MGSLSPGFGLERNDALITKLNADVAAQQAAMTILTGQIAAMQTFAAGLNTGNYYTVGQVDTLLNAKANASHLHNVNDLSITSEAKAFLAAATLADMRLALGLGSSAVLSTDSFEPKGALSTSGEVEERARDAVASSLRYKSLILLKGDGSKWPETGNPAGPWQLREGTTVFESGSSSPPPAGFSWSHEDSGDFITLRSIAIAREAGAGTSFDLNYGSNGGF